MKRTTLTMMAAFTLIACGGEKKSDEAKPAPSAKAKPQASAKPKASTQSAKAKVEPKKTKAVVKPKPEVKKVAKAKLDKVKPNTDDMDATFVKIPKTALELMVPKDWKQEPNPDMLIASAPDDKAGLLAFAYDKKAATGEDLLVELVKEIGFDGCIPGEDSDEPIAVGVNEIPAQLGDAVCTKGDETVHLVAANFMGDDLHVLLVALVDADEAVARIADAVVPIATVHIVE